MFAVMKTVPDSLVSPWSVIVGHTDTQADNCEEICRYCAAGHNNTETGDYNQRFFLPPKSV